MAACELSIELDEPTKVYTDGEKIRGNVIVRANQDIQCKALTVSSRWTTHGRGNIDSAEVDSQVAYTGAWQTGQEYRYPFELATAHWPPTYYGTYINVSHQVQAVASVAWAIDPKTTEEFLVAASHSPLDLAPARKQTANLRILGWIIAIAILAIFGTVFLLFVPFLLVIGGAIWFFTSYLPKSITGNVECKVGPQRLKAGEQIQGSIHFVPKRKSQVNGVRATVRCQEVCVSGSGSNRKTHRHEIASQSFVLRDAGELKTGQKEFRNFHYEIPASAPPSMQLSDNSIQWFVEFRVDIPRWPDYQKKVEFIIEPAADPILLAEVVEAHRPPDQDWFGEVVEQLYASADEPQRLARVVEAIRSHEFDLSLEVRQPVARPIEAQDIHGGRWFETYDREHDETILLHDANGRKPLEPQTTWQGTISIIAFRAESAKIIAAIIPKDIP